MTDTGLMRTSGTGGQLAEIWGDVVSRPQLGKAMVIGAVLSVAVYFIALAVIAPLATTPAVGKALAMLAGILGSVGSGAICARIFPPKRVVVEQVSSGTTWQADVLEQLEQDGGPIGRVQDLPPVVVEEMRQVGLYEVFQSYEKDRQTGSRGE
jgi:hypothetical protein